jgi:PHD/YefM family antitoxin component YafN of YafNO toxin-antitoxin module
MDDMAHIMPVTKVKRGLLDILKVMAEEDCTITLTRNGEAAGVLMTPARYEALLETIEVLADQKAMAALAASAQDFGQGRVLKEAEVWEG